MTACSRLLRLLQVLYVLNSLAYIVSQPHSMVWSYVCVAQAAVFTFVYLVLFLQFVLQSALT
jgi:hypothetical protein